MTDWTPLERAMLYDKLAQYDAARRAGANRFRLDWINNDIRALSGGMGVARVRALLQNVPNPCPRCERQDDNRLTDSVCDTCAVEIIGGNGETSHDNLPND